MRHCVTILPEFMTIFSDGYQHMLKVGIIVLCSQELLDCQTLPPLSIQKQPLKNFIIHVCYTVCLQICCNPCKSSNLSTFVPIYIIKQKLPTLFF